MKAQVKNKIIAGTITAAFIIAAGGAGFYYNKSSKLKSDVNNELLKNEKLLSEKLNLDKQLLFVNNNLDSLQTLSNRLNADLKKENNEKNKISGALNDAKRKLRKLEALKKEISKLTAQKTELAEKVQRLQSENTQLKSQASAMQKKVDQLENENADLNKSIAQLRNMRTNGFLVESLKKNDKTTVKAAKTKSIKTSFILDDAAAEEVLVKLCDSKGKIISQQKVNVAGARLKNDLANLNYDKETDVQKRIEIEIAPKTKLKKGIYSVKVYNKETYLGENLITLR